MEELNNLSEVTWWISQVTSSIRSCSTPREF